MKHNDSIALLQKYWGYTSFRGSQERIISTLLDDRDVLALLPTGGGKSLCFQIPAMAKAGICIVVSPLIALIQDQVARLKEVGIKAIALTGGIPQNEVLQLLDNCRFGNYKFLYLSPERLRQEMVRERLKQLEVNLCAIDEAHCISQWGHDFRPAYLECNQLRALFPKVPMIALTATATKSVSEDIVSLLDLDRPLIVKDSFARDNIAFEVVHTEDKSYQLKQLLAKNDKSAIVYVRTRRATLAISDYLKAKGFTATFYHGGISQTEKQKRLRSWLSNEQRIMVATNAFGMGIDKPDVGVVVHYQIPDTIENYFQEAGRAGRDGSPSKAVLLTNPSDMEQVYDQFIRVLPDMGFVKTLYRHLNNGFQIAYGEGNDTEHHLNFNAFCDRYGLPPRLAYNALRILDQYSVIALNEAFNQKTWIQIIVGKQALFDYMDSQRELEPILKTVLRTYGGVFDFETKINPFLIGQKAGISEQRLFALLKKLQTDEIIAYQARENDLSITFLVPREDERTLHWFGKEVNERRQLKISNLRYMLAYVRTGDICRKRQLLRYFGERATEDCGQCDVCLGRKRPSENADILIKKKIMASLAEREKDSRTLLSELKVGQAQLLRLLQSLLEEGSIAINAINEYHLL